MTAAKPGYPTSDGWAPPVNRRLPDFPRSNVDATGNIVEDERGDPLVTHPKTGEQVRYWAPSAYGTVLENQYNLWMFPVVLGRGKRLFEAGATPRGLRLVACRTSPSGVVMSTYEPTGDVPLGSFASAEPSAKELQRRAKLAREAA